MLTFLSDKLLGGQWQASGGDLVLLVAASFFSYYTVAAKPLIERLGGVTVMTYAVLFGSVPVVRSACRPACAVAWSEVAPAIWAGTFYAVIISAFCGWLVWGWVNVVARRRADRAADVPDAAGRRPRRLGAHRRALHRDQDRAARR